MDKSLIIKHEQLSKAGLVNKHLQIPIYVTHVQMVVSGWPSLLQLIFTIPHILIVSLKLAVFAHHNI